MKQISPIKMTDDFLKMKGSKFALYGAGEGGISCYNYMQTIGFGETIMFFIDSNPLKHGDRLFGKEIRGPECLKDGEDIAVVISTMYFNDVYKKIREIGCTNKVFVHVRFEPPYNKNSALDVHTEDILRFYDSSDMYTRNIVESVVFLRKKEFCAIQPVEGYLSLSGEPSYWCVNDTSLIKFDALTICDGGAFTGDTAEFLFGMYGEKIKKYYAFESDREIFSVMCKNLSFITSVSGREIIIPYCYGLGDKDEITSFNTTGVNTGHHFGAEGDVVAEVKALDSLDIEVHGKLCIKMDIEGYELKALEGARETIVKYKPNLAICMYHKPNDIWEIPKYIKSINPEYNCILRCGIHMVCYAAIPR
ncbi:MAG: FkbM family methyltransferase [Synergistaceae bacterium]|nr:FkbM family methyltransferase [Synergistaceae bacterium]